ncbi:MAG: glucose-6-phosphate dehydrogenase [Gemmatimonadales bacterium]|jgi:glucose-6-phosphate 1-dehydrogenase
MESHVIDDAHRGISPGAPPKPCTLVIFGASGDLTHRELIPALYELERQALLPESFSVIGFAWSEWSDETFQDKMREATKQQCAFDEDSWKTFAKRLRYVQGEFDAAADADYADLKKRLEEIQASDDLPDNVMFHLATPPKFFTTIVQRLSAAGLANSENGWRRLVIEKPFGEDEGTARQLNEEIREVFEEEQIYRIDHFLGKETVQNMLVFRFANPSFEPIWNRNYIDHVQITVAEDIGIGTRAGFYEKTGVVRDMVQNHLLQLLCMTTIEPPVRFNGASLRDATVNVLEAVQPLDPQECVRGQYGPGTIDGERVAGYRQEEDVASGSWTSTFAAAKLTIDNWRWAGVPFYLRTGKRMTEKFTEVAIHFKPTPHLMFPVSLDQLHSNVLVFRLQPEEGIIQVYAAKRPGPRLHIEPVRSSFLYASAFGVDEPPRAYAWLLLDVMNGDQTLFARVDWIYKAWSIVDPLIEHWEAEPPDDFPNYAAGTWGPKGAEKLIEPRAWLLI